MGKRPKSVPNTFLRNGTFYLQVRVPKELVESYGGKLFKTESLGTKEVWEALAKSQRRKAEVQREFDEKRVVKATAASESPALAAPPPGPALSFAEIARQHARNVCDGEFAERARVFEAATAVDSKPFWHGEVVSLPDSRYFDHLVEEGDLDRIVGYLARARIKDRVAELRKMLATGNLAELTAVARERSQGIDGARQLVLARIIARAEIEALEALAAGEPDAGIQAAAELSGSPAEPQEHVSRVTTVAAAPSKLQSTEIGQGPRLSLVLANWIEEKDRTRAWRAKTRHEREASVKAFIEVIGDHSVGSYAKADAKRFKDVLFNIPPNAHKKAAYKGLGLVAIAEKAATTGDQKPTAKNVALKMDAVSALFIWARKNFDEVSVNPIEGLKPQVDTVAREERDPFTAVELKAMFAAPPFTGAVSEQHWLQRGVKVLTSTGKFWTPLIALYSGARLMEIVQMQRADVQTTSGVTFFDITDVVTIGDKTVPDPSSEGGGEWKQLKTRGAKRRIPVHPALVTAGFLEFLANKNPADRLFPDIEIGGAKNRSSPASKLFGRLIRAAGVKSRKNCFHSFRHSFEDACRDAEIDSAVMNALQGHVEPGMAGRYGSAFKLERLHAAVRKISFGLPFEAMGRSAEGAPEITSGAA